METSFVTSEARIIELQRYMRQCLPTARFVGNPIKLSSDSWQVCLVLNGTDDIQLFNELMNKWTAEDTVASACRQTWLERIFDFLRKL